jgi:hypothetical protein
MKFHPVGAEMFHADGQTVRETDSRHDEANSRFFSIFRTRLKTTQL